MTKTVQADAVKFYTRRDSATAALRKLGVKPCDYNLFIEKISDDKFACQLLKAEMHLKSLTVGATHKPEPTKAVVKKAETVEVIATKSGSISAVARSMITNGYSNQEIWQKLKSEFKLDDSKKHYPTWYRCEMKRRGLLTV